MIKLHLQGLQSRHLATKVIRDSVNIDPGDWFWFIYILIYIDIDIVTCQYHIISINQPTNEMRSTCPCGAARDWRIRSDLETGWAHEGFQAAWKYKYKSHRGMEDSQNRRNTGLKKAPTGASWEPGAGQKHLDQMSGLGFPSTQSAAASWELKSSKSQKSTNCVHPHTLDYHQEKPEHLQSSRLDRLNSVSRQSPEDSDIRRSKSASN